MCRKPQKEGGLYIDVKITPAALQGEVRAIASKSDAHRCLICAALCDTPTEVVISDLNRDIEATMRCLVSLGADIAPLGAEVWRVTPNAQPPASPVLDCGESGSTLRFLLPVAAARCSSARLEGAGRLPQRPLSPLREELEAHGCTFDAAHLPFTVRGPLKAGRFTLPGNVSSQYVTGLLLALPLLDADSEILLTTSLESAGYVAMTLRTLKQFGIAVIALPNGGGYRIGGGQRYRSPGRIAAEGDWSNAAFWLAAGAVSGPVAVTGLEPDTAQGDSEILPILARFGAQITQRDGHAAVSPRPLKAITVDAAEIPDLVPVLAVVACAAAGTTRIINAARLRIKESDRLKTVSESLTALGGRVTELPDGLVIEGVGRLKGGVIDSFNDHRIAMAMSVAAAISTGDVVIRDAAAVEKSYPEFFEDYKTLGGKIDVL